MSSVRSRSFVCRTMGVASWLLNFLVNLSKEACEYLREDFTSTLHTALGELVDAGLVDRTPEQIRLADPLFAHYIRGRITTVFANK